MTLEDIQKRVVDLLQQKKQLENQYKQTEQQLFMLQGHINELQHQMTLMNNSTNKKDDNQLEKEEINSEMQVM